MKAKVTVDTDRQLGAVNPNIYGHFLSRRKWVADGGLHSPAHQDADEGGLRSQVLQAIKDIAPPVVRWPGGCTGTSYDWLEGVGPAAERSRTIDAHFGYGVSNGFGTAEFIDFCRKVGAAPHINLTTGTGSLREALAWVEYCNLDTDTKWANLRRKHGHQAPFDVPYWQIGNEEWGKWEIGYTNKKDYAQRAREWAKSIKRLDPRAQTLALGHYKDFDLVEWNHEVLTVAGEHLDYLTFHQYWDFDSAKGDDQYDMIAGAGYLEEQKIRALSSLIDLVGREQKWRKLPKIAFTEWNARDVSHNEMTPGWRPGLPQYRLADALAAAGFINAMQRQSSAVTMANIAQTINVVGILVVTDDVVFREPVYWALHMQRHLSGTVAVDAKVTCESYSVLPAGAPAAEIPYLDVSATSDIEKRKLYVSIVNRHRTAAVQTELDLGVVASGTASLHELWHQDPFGQNTSETPDNVCPRSREVEIEGGKVTLELRPHSCTILEFATS